MHKNRYKKTISKSFLDQGESQLIEVYLLFLSKHLGMLEGPSICGRKLVQGVRQVPEREDRLQVHGGESTSHGVVDLQAPKTLLLSCDFLVSCRVGRQREK